MSVGGCEWEAVSVGSCEYNCVYLHKGDNCMCSKEGVGVGGCVGGWMWEAVSVGGCEYGRL